jgi:hypothetical protein
MNKFKLLILIIALGYIFLTFLPEHYTTDWGNGVIIHADKYVNSGEWIYNCKKSFLVSRIPRSPPTKEALRGWQPSRLIESLAQGRKASTLSVINATTSKANWHHSLRYTFTGLYENSKISAHYFEMTAYHKAKLWTLQVRQLHAPDKDKAYSINASPFDPNRHKLHKELVEEARVSCPTPQS